MLLCLHFFARKHKVRGRLAVPLAAARDPVILAKRVSPGSER